jgi:hypothetical protein
VYVQDKQKEQRYSNCGVERCNIPRSGILHNISWERAFQITLKLCLHVEATEKHDIREFRQRANEIILKIATIPET